MGANFHIEPTSESKWRVIDVEAWLGALDNGITYMKNIIIHCDGGISYNSGTGQLTWSDTLRILFNREDGDACENTIAAGNITLSDNQFCYVDVNDTNGTVLTVAAATVTPDGASNFIAVNRLVLGYRNTSSDEYFPVYLNLTGGGDVDAIHDNISGEINAVTEKTALVADDLILIEDSEASNVKKKVKLSSLSSVSTDFIGDFDEDPGTTTGLSWGWVAGTLRVDNAIYVVSASTITLIDDTVNYVELDPSDQTIKRNDTAFTAGRIPLRQVTTSSGSQTVSTDKRAVIVDTSGVTDYASSAEINTGTEAEKSINPDALAGSHLGEKGFSVALIASDTDVAVADGTYAFCVPEAMSNMDIIACVATVHTAGTTGTTDIQIRRRRDVSNVDVLSTKLTIDTGETSSTTATTPFVVNTSNDDLDEGDLIFIDIDAVSTTAPKGLFVTVMAQLP